MLLVTAEQIRQADAAAIEGAGIPGAVLMENAAQGAARVAINYLGSVEGLDLAAFCGRGNNGGDGFAVLRILANRGASATAYLFCRSEDLSGDAALNCRVAKACGVRVLEVPDDKAYESLSGEMAGHDFYFDALLGTGLNSPVRGRYAKAIELLNNLPSPVMAIDIPSGLSADTGTALGTAVAADATVTFGLVKLGLALEPGDLVGELHLVDISIPPDAVQHLGVKSAFLSGQEVALALPDRPKSSHKGDYGHLMVVGGSPGKTGAPLLAAWGGIRSGAGLVTVGLPRDLNPVAETSLLTAMSQPLPQTSEGCLALGAGETLLLMMASRQAMVLGPGLSTQAESADLARALMEQVEAPLVVDADGLNALAGQSGKLKFASRQVVLTPHPGEAARLLGCTSAEIQADRPAAVRRLASENNAVVVLKGARSLIADPDGWLWVNSTGNPLLASGGSGDVLAGLIGGLMAQGMESLEAACAGAFFHGLAADLAAEDFGQRGLSAQELVDYLPAAFASLEASEEGLDEEDDES